MHNILINWPIASQCIVIVIKLLPKASPPTVQDCTSLHFSHPLQVLVTEAGIDFSRCRYRLRADRVARWFNKHLEGNFSQILLPGFITSVPTPTNISCTHSKCVRILDVRCTCLSNFCECARKQIGCSYLGLNYGYTMHSLYTHMLGAA